MRRRPAAKGVDSQLAGGDTPIPQRRARARALGREVARLGARSRWWGGLDLVRGGRLHTSPSGRGNKLLLEQRAQAAQPTTGAQQYSSGSNTLAAAARRRRCQRATAGGREGIMSQAGEPIDSRLQPAPGSKTQGCSRNGACQLLAGVSKPCLPGNLHSARRLRKPSGRSLLPKQPGAMAQSTRLPKRSAACFQTFS